MVSEAGAGGAGEGWTRRRSPASWRHGLSSTWFLAKCGQVICGA